MIPLLLLACREPPPPPPLAFPDRPNVLIIVWDTVRADRMSLHGHTAITTPHLDAYARTARVFEQAISPGFWTLPAHASLLTGLPVTAHGATWQTPWLDDEFTTMAEWFVQHGYASYGWSTNPNLHPGRNTIQGFQTYQHPFGDDSNPWREPVLSATRKRMDPADASTPSSPAWSGKKKTAATIAGPVAPGAFVDWLHQGRPVEQPFWALINLMETHDPRFPTSDTRTAILADRAEASLALNASPGRMRRATPGAAPYSEDEREILRSVYDATLADLDASTHDLLTTLTRLGALENTIVVITSDHGELLGEHGLYRHNRSLYDPLVHVPLVVSYPPAVTPGRHAGPVSTASVFATVAGLAGLPLPEVPQMMRGSLLDADATTPVFTECLEPVGDRKDGDPDTMWRTSRAVVSQGWKLISYDDGAVELFDRSTDPGEKVDRAVTATPQRDAMSAVLEGWVGGLEAHTPVVPERAEGLMTGQGGESMIRAGVQEALEALGYVE